jgi:hypothetical protein
MIDKEENDQTLSNNSEWLTTSPPKAVDKTATSKEGVTGRIVAGKDEVEEGEGLKRSEGSRKVPRAKGSTRITTGFAPGP